MSVAHPAPPIEALLARSPELQPCAADILAAHHLLRDATRAGGKLLLCGNGGSAADCEHWAAELLKGMARPRPLGPRQRAGLPEPLARALQRGIPAIPLPSLLSLNSAVSNDTGHPLGFAQATWVLGQPGDVLVGITTSGRSGSVLAAVDVARARGLSVLVLTGLEGAHLAELADVCIAVPRRACWEVQELHLPVYHCLSRMLEDDLLATEAP
jgi:D-sedoheptulose 7-phosphate isomerase